MCVFVCDDIYISDMGSIPELELMVKSNSGIGINYLIKLGIEFEKFGIDKIAIEVTYKKIKSTN